MAASVVPRVRTLLLRDACPLRYLVLEEALLRGTRDNWLVVLDGAAPEDDRKRRTAILGLGGKKEEWVDGEAAKDMQVPVLRRFTGGGAVVVDENTIFVSTILNAGDAPDVELAPGPIMEFVHRLYAPAWRGVLSLRENDFVLTDTDTKFGGNAQAITKGRWLQHTSVLWDADVDGMTRLLRPPTRRPEYRGARDHKSFLRTLSSAWSGSREDFLQSALAAPRLAGWDVVRTSSSDALASARLALADARLRISSAVVASNGLRVADVRAHAMSA